METMPHNDPLYSETKLSARGIGVALALAVISAALAGGIVWSYEQNKVDDLKAQLDVQAQDLEKAQYQVKHNKPMSMPVTTNQTAH